MPTQSDLTNPKARLADARTWAGYRSARITRSTGTMVVVLDGNAADLDTSGGRWTALCDDHSSTLAAETLALATSAALEPEEWCDRCRFWFDAHAEDLPKVSGGCDDLPDSHGDDVEDLGPQDDEIPRDARLRHPDNGSCDGRPRSACVECDAGVCDCERAFGHDCEVAS